MEEYVDIDYYGRGLFGLYGLKDGEKTVRRTLMNLITSRKMKERLNPQVHIDWDLYGRGDPRVFGSDDDSETQDDVQANLEGAQPVREDDNNRSVDICAVLFPAKLKTIGKKASAKFRCMPSAKMDEKRNDSVVIDCICTDEMHTEEIISNSRESHRTERVDEVRELVVSNEAPAAIELGLEVETSSNEEPSTFVEETSSLCQVVDDSPHRFKSKLPSEELRPFVEEGHVARMVRYFSSFESVSETPSPISSGTASYGDDVTPPFVTSSLASLRGIAGRFRKVRRTVA